TPVALDDLVRIVAELWDVSDVQPEIDLSAIASDAMPSDELETRQNLSVLWKEIVQLQPRQRTALLLNLRDGDGLNALSLFVLAGVAALREIAAAVSLTPQRLGELWNDLPLDDLTIGSLIGATRQQVINLRKAARERLARRFNRLL